MPTKTKAEQKVDALTALCRRLAAHASVVAVAVLDPEAVPAADLEVAVKGLHDVQSELLELSP
jgi:hypothetical protein